MHNFGIFLWGGDRITVEKNNVFDLFQSKDVDDVDAMRAWGTNHIVRNNYFHDINAKKSAGSPHSDCFQAYQASSGRGLQQHPIENNYCVRVTGQCFIVQNDLRNADELHDLRHPRERLRDLRLADHRDDRHPEHHHGQQLRRRRARELL